MTMIMMVRMLRLHTLYACRLLPINEGDPSTEIGGSTSGCVLFGFMITFTLG